MNNRKYINQITNFIETEVKSHRDENSFITRDFFESKKLKGVIKERLKSLANLFKWPIPDEKLFSLLFQIAIKEYRDKNSTDILPSISIRKTHLESWLTKERQDELKWNSDYISTYRNRYLQYLSDIGRPKKYIDETSRSSLEILKRWETLNLKKNFMLKD